MESTQPIPPNLLRPLQDDRECAGCGRDISDLRFDAKSCKQCRSFRYRAATEVQRSLVTVAHYAELRQAIEKLVAQQSRKVIGYSLRHLLDKVGQVTVPEGWRRTRRAPDENGRVRVAKRPYFELAPFECPKVPVCGTYEVTLHFADRTTVHTERFFEIGIAYPYVNFSDGTYHYDRTGQLRWPRNTARPQPERTTEKKPRTRRRVSQTAQPGARSVGAQPDPTTQQAVARLEALEKESKAQKAALEAQKVALEAALEDQKAVFEERLAEAAMEHRAEKAALEERLAEAEARVVNEPAARPANRPDNGTLARLELLALKEERDKERTEQRKLKHAVEELSARLVELERNRSVPDIVTQPASQTVKAPSGVTPIAESPPAPAATATLSPVATVTPQQAAAVSAPRSRATMPSQAAAKSSQAVAPIPSQTTPISSAPPTEPPTAPEPAPRAPQSATGPPPAMASSPPSTATPAKQMGWRPPSANPPQQRPKTSSRGTLGGILFDPTRDPSRGKNKRR